LIAIPGVLAWSIFQQHSAPPNLLAVGFVGDMTEEPWGHGLYSNVHIDVDGCSNPVHVTVEVNGTTEYWQRAASSMHRTATVGFALSGPGIGDPQLRVPPIEEFGHPGVSDPGSGRELAPEGFISNVRTVEGSTSEGFETTVGAATLNDWGKYQLPIDATFSADWIHPRDGNSCFLTLPALVDRGLACTQAVSELALNIGQAEVNESREDSPICLGEKRGPELGRVEVQAEGATVSSTESQPPPVNRELPTWYCRSRPFSPLKPIGIPGHFPEIPPPYRSELLRQTREDSHCRGTAVLVESGGPGRDNFLLLLYGALIGLGATLVVEVLIETTRRRLAASAV
jgi:hypothetical protein